MHSRSGTVTWWFLPQQRVSMLQGCWVSLAFDVATVGRTATEATHSERTQDTMQGLQAQLGVGTNHDHSIVCEKNYDSSTHKRIPPVLYNKASFASLPASQPMAGTVTEKPHSLKGCCMCEDFNFTTHHLAIYSNCWLEMTLSWLPSVQAMCTWFKRTWMSSK